MFRSCPATGRLSHKFNSETHRCACGRWERGFKPKNENARPRAECQICERQQAVGADGLLVHHGYKRPGWGFIVGDCSGVHHRPYPATDALVKYLEAVRQYIVKCETALAKLPTLTEITHAYKVRVKVDGRHEYQERTTVIKVGDVRNYVFETNTTFPSFEDKIQQEMWKVQQELGFARKDEARVVKRIAAAAEVVEACGGVS